jgi:hypothetical protein
MSDGRVDVYALSESEAQTLREVDWTTEADSAKYDTVAAFKLWTLSLSSFHDDSCGSAVDGNAWYGLFTPDAGDGESGPVGGGAILTCGSQGFVSASRFDTVAECAETWAATEREAAEFEGEGE